MKKHTGLIWPMAKESTVALDFNNPSFTDDVCLTWTGWTRSQFQSMLDCLQITIDSCQRDRSTAPLIFWVKLKTGLSFQQIASLMNKNTDSGIKMVSRFFLFYVLVFKIFLCCWRLMYVFIFLVKLR